MHLFVKSSRVLKIGGIAAAVVAGILVMGGSAFASPAPTLSHQVKIHPLIQKVTKAPNAATFGCQGLPIDGSQGIVCYSPQQIQNAYGITPLLNKGVTGKGRTIAIIDAFSNPYLAGDLAIQDTTFGLPTANFNTIAPQGVPAFDQSNADMDGWAEEMTLDVLWSHVAAPGAKILLVEAKSDQDIDLYNATKYVVDNNLADVISQSFGEAETCMDPTIQQEEHALFEQAAEKGITVFASAGDSGASQFNCDGTGPILSVGIPASDPMVTGVGGTTLAADINGKYQGETAWTEGLFTTCNPPDSDDINCSGGGFSTLYDRPFYQVGVPGTEHGHRGVPDVSYNAGVNGGVLTHCGICNVLNGFLANDPTIFFIFGGTSAGSPQWAGLTTLGDQLAHRRLGFINPALYRISEIPGLYQTAFHDVTMGDNDVADLNGEGYNAHRGWDPVTGLGTPNAAVLEPLLSVFSFGNDVQNGVQNSGGD